MRAGLAGGKAGKLTKYKWSSLPDYHRGSGVDWLVMDRLLDAFQLSKDGRGRKAYVAWLEARAEEGGEVISDEATKALRRGWYLGEPGFADKLRALVKPEAKKIGRDPVGRRHDELEAERILKKAAALIDLPVKISQLSKLSKGDKKKVLIACLLRQRTSVGNGWLSERFVMGHTASVSRLLGDFMRSRSGTRELAKLAKMLKRSS